MTVGCCYFVRTLGDGLMLLFRTYPSILMEQWEEVREYVGNSRNIVDREEFFTYVVSVIDCTFFHHGAGTNLRNCRNFCSTFSVLIFSSVLLVKMVRMFRCCDIVNDYDNM